MSNYEFNDSHVQSESHDKRIATDTIPCGSS